MNKPFYGAASMTCSNRSQIINIQCSQGPGSYDVNKQKYTSSLPKWSLKPRLEHGSCFKTSKQNRPHPGSYQINGDMKQRVKLKNPNYRSDKCKQSNQKVTHMSHLNIPSSISQKCGASFGYRDELVTFKQTDTSPGPIYHTAKNFQQARSNKIKNTCRGFGFGQKNGIYKTNYDVPGPGAYVNQSPKRQLSPANSTFGKSPRIGQSNTCSLGPGEYSPNLTNNGTSLADCGRTFKFKGKLPQAQKYVNPNGPGTYDLPDTKSNVGPRFHHSKNNSNNLEQGSNEKLSPFAYDCKRYPESIDQNKGFSLGKRIYSQCRLKTMDLGPGAYEISENISNNHMGGYMGRKIVKKKKISQQDCFGKYDPKFSASARQGSKFSFSTDPKTWNKQVKDETLGPGFYKLKEKSYIQSYSMGTSQRFKPLKKQAGFLYSQNTNMNSTIGYMPSYLRKQSQKNLKTSS